MSSGISVQEIRVDHAAETVESAKMILRDVAMLSKLTSHLKNETKAGEASLETLTQHIHQAEKDVSRLRTCVDSLLLVAKKMVHLSLDMVPLGDPSYNAHALEAEKLLSAFDDISDEEYFNGKLKTPCFGPKLDTKCLNIDEKYPLLTRGETVLDLRKLGSLATVPEDGFVDFSQANSSSVKTNYEEKHPLKKMSAEVLFATSTNNFSDISDPLVVSENTTEKTSTLNDTNLKN